jgi:hypothetical protein
MSPQIKTKIFPDDVLIFVSEQNFCCCSTCSLKSLKKCLSKSDHLLQEEWKDYGVIEI